MLSPKDGARARARNRSICEFDYEHEHHFIEHEHEFKLKGAGKDEGWHPWLSRAIAPRFRTKIQRSIVDSLLLQRKILGIVQ